MRTNILADKSFDFAKRVVKLYKFLKTKHIEYDLSKQLLRSGTAIGALIMESEYGSTKKDFSFKYRMGFCKSMYQRSTEIDALLVFK